MKKLFLIRNPEIFQGERKIRKRKNYFEGWYFKNTNGYDSVAFIPGISITKKDKKAFIQVITNNSSYYINYHINEFSFDYDPFYIKIGNNYFDKDKIYININDEEHELVIQGEIRYSNHINISTDAINPNIMGPFSYLSFMECNHAILSMKANADGYIYINDNNIQFDNGFGYIEKDWGYSFPKNYIWCQGNQFQNTNSAFMISIADIPFKIFHFRGFICSLIIKGKEYRFATYNGDKIMKCVTTNNSLNIILKKKNYYLYIESNYHDGHTLMAPVKGEMNKYILESISEDITVTLCKNNKIIFSDTSINCGLEIVLE